MSPARINGAVLDAPVSAGRARSVPTCESALARARVSDVTHPRTRVGEIQRSRLLAGAAATIDEFGYPRATVGRMVLMSRKARIRCGQNCSRHHL